MSKTVETYLRKKEIEKMKRSGASYEDIKAKILNDFENNDFKGKQSNGYQKFVGKGSLDQRLRAIVAYKRSNIADEGKSSDSSDQSCLSASDLDELEELMNSDEEDDDLEEDNEEFLVESLVVQSLEQSKRSEMMKNFQLEKASMQTTSPTETSNSSSSSAPKDSVSEFVEEELYTPKVSSWGIFPRPRDISKAYGGGRVLPIVDPKKREEEYFRYEREEAIKASTQSSNLLKLENEKESKIKESLSRARGLMGIGNTKGAVAILEEIKDYLSWNSDLAGEVWLEYAMALETVDRTDDARKVYGKLMTASWSSKTRRNAIQLLQGLEMSLKIRNNIGPVKPVVDDEAMLSISQALKKGLTNEWDDYKKDKPRDNLLPWYGEEIMSQAEAGPIRNLEDAYMALLRIANPLKDTSVSTIRRAFRVINVSNETERARFFRRRGILSVAEETPSQDNSSPLSHLPKQTPHAAESAQVGNDVIDTTSALFSSFRNDLSSEYVSKKQSNQAKKMTRSSEAFTTYLNGSWDLVVSMTDRAPFRVSRYEVDSIVRRLDVSKNQCLETVPLFWGMSSITRQCDSIWDAARCELSLSGDNIKKSSVPCARKGDIQTFKVIFCDDNVQVTRQSSAEIGSPDVYCLWKRKRPPQWRKY